jgi:hypothetical protein
MIKKYFAFVFIACLFASCLGKPDFSSVPAITFKKLTLLPSQRGFGDSMVLTITFQDGDGNLGNSTGDNVNNFFVRGFRKQRGVFNPMVLPDGQTFDGIFPVLDIVGGSPLEGELRYGVPFDYLLDTDPFRRLRKGDTVRFTVQIQDRAGNKSNTVETNEVILGRYE